MNGMTDSAPKQETAAAWTPMKVLHYVVLGLLILGGAAYWYLTPATLNPMADPRAAEALALVQTHRAAQAPTLLQALTDRVKVLKGRGQGVRVGEWRVQHLQGDFYIVRVWVREQGTREWFEREYVWRADLSRRVVAAMTRAALDLMPRELGAPDPIASDTMS